MPSPFAPHARPRLRTCALVIAALCCGCSTADQNEDADSGDDMATTDLARVATGVVDDTDIFVAAVRTDDRVIAYFCGGASTYESHTHWFAGEPGEDGAFELSLGDAQVTGQFDEDGVSGTLTDRAGMTHSFSLDGAAEDSTEGLYSLDLDDGCRAAAVITDVGGTPTGQGVYACDDDALFVQVIILAPSDLTAGGEAEATFDLQDGAGEQTVLLPPV